MDEEIAEIFSNMTPILQKSTVFDGQIPMNSAFAVVFCRNIGHDEPLTSLALALDGRATHSLRLARRISTDGQDFFTAIPGFAQDFRNPPLLAA